VLAEYIGPHKVLWATDYPHRDGFFPGASAMIAERLKGASAETRHQVMAGAFCGYGQARGKFSSTITLLLSGKKS